MGLGTDFGALVAAHGDAIGLVETRNVSETHTDDEELETIQERKIDEDRGEPSDLAQSGLSESHAPVSKVKKGTAKIGEEEQRETGHVSWKVYWLYITKAYGWYIILAFVYSSDTMADSSSGK